MLKYGMLSDVFEGAAAKYLTEVEINRFRSHQHEFQGVSALREILGTPSEKKRFVATFYWLDDNEDSEIVKLSSFCTWSDVRRDNPGRSAEYHLYYSSASEPVVHRASAGDLLIIANTRQQELLVFLCPANSTSERQLLWLFGLDPRPQRLDVKSMGIEDNVHIGYAARGILDDLGVEFSEPEPDAFAILMERYKDGFPDTKEFSRFARETAPDVDAAVSPDEALTVWMDQEVTLFRHLERYLVTEMLENGFVDDEGQADVDLFIKYSLSVHNRRKSRAGHAFGNHIEEILRSNHIQYTREAKTEGKKTPDFLFPGQNEYHQPTFSSASLTMLGAKTTCKDRWRQVLSEARRIDCKHLLTIEPGISVDQTDEMAYEHLQLIVPRSIFSSYTRDQQNWLLDVRGFLKLVKERQERRI